jgi:NADPH:quinone reductase-like Zn-dependent oxidoreductase
MRAAVRTRYGPPDVVQIMDVPTPAIGDRDLLVKVHATTVNRTDCGYRAARPFFIRPFSGLVRPRAAILGTEFAGEIEAVGGEVTAFAVGDRVFGYVEGRFGAHAEYLAVPETGSLATIPASLSYHAAAPGTEGSHYALSAIRAAKVKAGHDVLVNGATGAIGSAAVQLMKARGANVTGVCAAAHEDLVRSLGVDRIIAHDVDDFTQDDQVYDVVFDAVGKSSFGKCKRLLRPHGLYLSTDLGPRAQNPFLALASPVMRGRKVLFPIPKHDQAMVRWFRELLESGQFRPLIDRTYPLDRIVDAYRYVETGQKLGNVVITVQPPPSEG